MRPRAPWLALLLISPGIADGAPRSAAEGGSIEVAHAAAAPTIDGRLDEPLWANATVRDAFVARNPVDGGIPTLRTIVRLAYDAEALYVALEAFDPEPGSISARVLRRDDFDISADDQFVVALDPFRDRRNGYWFSTNPLGARVDAQFFDEGARFETGWNGVWSAAARIGPDRWTAELAIPWATLRFPSASTVEMGINFFRRVPRTHEQLYLPRIPLAYPYGTPSVSIAPVYRFEGLSARRRVDLRPFALVEHRSEDAGDDSDLDGGLFARAPLGSGLTMAATARADFSEVEADETQLNLTRFPLFLPEKRDFFLEGAGQFQFGSPGIAELFFSRRVGLTLEADGRATTVPIDWGAKVVGSLGKSEVAALLGETGGGAGAPGERFAVVRSRIYAGDSTTLGAFWSALAPESEPEHATAGVDLRHFFPERVELSSFFAWDDRGGEAERTRAWSLGLARGGDRAAFVASVLQLDSGFDPALGLVARPGTRRLEASGSLPWFPSEATGYRRFAPTLAYVRYDELDGAGFEATASATFGIEQLDDDSASISVVRRDERLTQGFAIFRDVVVPAGDFTATELQLAVASNPSRVLSGQGSLILGELYGGDHRGGTLALVWRPSRHWLLAPSVAADRVELPAATFTAWVARFRLGVTVDPKLRFDLLAQYDDERRETAAGLRARYDFAEGTQLLLAWDSIEIRDPLARTSGARRARPERQDRGALRFSYLFFL